MNEGGLALRDVREGGQWSASQRLKNDALYGLASVALWAARPWPRGALAFMGRNLGRLAHLLLARERRVARANVALAFPELPEGERRALARRAFVELGSLAGDVVSALTRSFSPLPFPEAARATLREALAEGRGVVLPSAHLGPWERVAATLVEAGFPLTTLIRESYDPRFDALFARLRSASKVEFIPRGHPGAAVRVVRALRKGRVLGAPMDLRSRVPSVAATLLGVPALTAVGPARIALRTGAAVVVATVERSTAGVLELTATRLDLAGMEGRSEAADLALTQAINEELSRRIRTAPELWPWMHARFDGSVPPIRG
jgi:KDO2-lipid IV(A) lauroyltransferase